MPSLKFFGLLAIVGTLLTATLLLLSTPSAKAELEQTPWGKSGGAFQARLVLRQQEGTRWTFEGQVKTALPEFSVAWKLPPQVQLIEGNLEETVQKNPEDPIASRTITIDAKSLGRNPHLIFYAYHLKDGERSGQTAVYNLAESPQDKAKTRMLQKMIREREAPPIK